jgi:hypothetical protein
VAVFGPCGEPLSVNVVVPVTVTVGVALAMENAVALDEAALLLPSAASDTCAV